MRKEILSNEERYHIYNRGAGKCDIFLDDEDRLKFLWNLQHYQYDKGMKPIVAISTFVLMSNHFHLSLQQSQDGGVSRFLNRVCKSYAQYFNEKYSRTGCLFSGRFQARHVQNDAYFLHLTRYIHRNPIDIAGASLLQDYAWSSYPTYLGLETSPIVTDLLGIQMFASPQEYKTFLQSWMPLEDLLILECIVD